MKNFLLILLLALISGCGHGSGDQSSPQHVSLFDAQEKCMEDSTEMMLKQATNDLIGIRSVISSSQPNMLSDHETNWEGILTLDYINAVGGVSRTNLYYRFACVTNDGDYYFDCSIDEAWYWAETTNRWAEESRREIAEAKAEADEKISELRMELSNLNDSTPPAPIPTLTPEQIEAAQQAEDERVERVTASTIKWLRTHQADNGDVYSQRRLGERYIKGAGVETNLAKGKELLTKAAAQGDKDASDLLAKLNGQ
jgi:hypothetical protein